MVLKYTTTTHNHRVSLFRNGGERLLSYYINKVSSQMQHMPCGNNAQTNTLRVFIRGSPPEEEEEGEGGVRERERQTEERVRT